MRAPAALTPATPAKTPTKASWRALAKEITEMKEIDIDKGTDRRIGEAHKLVECVVGKMKTMKLQTTDCSERLAFLKPPLNKNQSNVQSQSVEEPERPPEENLSNEEVAELTAEHAELQAMIVET